MKVYPSPMELMVIYEQTIPKPVFTVSSHCLIIFLLLSLGLQLVVQMMNADVSPRFPSSASGHSLSDDDEETSSTSGGPPSEASQEWDKVTDPGAYVS